MSADAASRPATAGGSGCPVCGRAVAPEVDLGDYRLFRCDGCGCWCSDAAWRRAETSFEPENYFAQDVEPEKWEHLDARLARAGRRVDSVLDVGCGTGAYLSHVGERRPAARRAGIEIDARRAGRAREVNPDARIVTGAAPAALEAIDGCFDLITLWDVFEHVVAPATLLRSLASRLSPEGCVFIQTIHEHSVVPALGRFSYRISGGRLKAAARRTHDAHHLVFFTRRGLRMLADGADLRISEQWFDHLARRRMDGNRALTWLTAAALNLEHLFGTGLFVNLICERRDPEGVSRRP